MTCIVCDGQAVTSAMAGLLVKCDTCGHLWADVDHGSLHDLYGREYFHGSEYRDYLADRPALERNFAARLATLATLVDSSHRRLLEIGSAYGLFLNLARRRFDRVAGIDITDEGVRYAREQLGLDVRHGDLLDTDWRGERFDVVCAWDTIEHLGQPGEYVRTVADLVTPGGLLALTTGDAGSANARLRGARWRLIHPPTHVHYFSAATLTRLLDRYGFDVIHLEHPGVYRSLGTMIHNIVDARWGWRSLGRFLAGSWLGRTQAYLNLYDVMYVIARRRQ